MSPTSISGGGKPLTGGELISPASLKHQEEDLSSTNLEQRCYKVYRFTLSNISLSKILEKGRGEKSCALSMRKGLSCKLCLLWKDPWVILYEGVTWQQAVSPRGKAKCKIRLARKCAVDQPARKRGERRGTAYPDIDHSLAAPYRSKKITARARNLAVIFL